MTLLLLALTHATLAAPDAAEVSSGLGHSCLLRGDGSVACWGGVDGATLKAGGAPSTVVPTRVAGIDAVTQLSAGGSLSTCAVRGAGELWCWVVDGAPVRVPGAQAAGVSVGNAHTCYLTPKGEVWCWGYNGRGQLGDGTTTDRAAPVQAVGLTDAVQLSAGYYHTCAVRRSGQVACWGNNALGQIGDGSGLPSVTRPVTVPYLEDAVTVSAGAFHTCALRRTGRVACWGANSSGELGDGTRDGSSVVTAVQNLDSVVQLDAGMEHTCAVRRGGIVACWGANDHGQLGNPRRNDQLLPAPVEGVTDATFVSAGQQHTCALRATGGPACWGSNWTGQLGDGTRDDRSMPTPVRQD